VGNLVGNLVFRWTFLVEVMVRYPRMMQRDHHHLMPHSGCHSHHHQEDQVVQEVPEDQEDLEDLEVPVQLHHLVGLVGLVGLVLVVDDHLDDRLDDRLGDHLVSQSLQDHHRLQDDGCYHHLQELVPVVVSLLL